MNLLRKIVDWVWRTPKDKVAECLRNKCDAMPHKQRLTVVGLLFGILTLTAFLLFGHACYKMGAQEQRVKFEIEHMSIPDFETTVNKDKMRRMELIENQIDSLPDYDDTATKRLD